MIPAYATVLGLRVCPTNVRGQKINKSTLSSNDMILATFQLEEKQGRTRFFQETFLVADSAMKVVLEMSFLALNKVEINFVER